MSRAVEVQSNDLIRGLAEFSSTALATGIGVVTREVLKRGAAVITKHDEPVMVLVSLERYIELEKAAAPNLDALARHFDDLYARMQSPSVADDTIAALDLGARSGKVVKRAARRRA